MTKEIRCPSCNKLNCKASEESYIETACRKCGTLFNFVNGVVKFVSQKKIRNGRLRM